MSWLIQSLLNNSSTIKEESDLDSDQFNDLLFVEKAISELYEKKLLTDEDLQVIDNFTNPSVTVKKTEWERHTLSKRYSQICNRIAYYLGGYFTDDGYLNYMQEKYKLSDEQMNILRNYIESRYRHRIARKSYVTEEKNEAKRDI